MSFADVAGYGPFLPLVGVTALTGVVSFVVWCTLPPVPGHLAYMIRLTGSDLASAAPEPVAGPVSPVAGPATAPRSPPDRAR